MDPRYTCKSTQRREAILDKFPSINGIDFLEVVDSAIPIASARQRILVVRALHPVASPFSADQVEISGGVRITPVKALWAQRLAEVITAPASGMVASERSWLRHDFLNALPGCPAPNLNPAGWAAAGWHEPDHWLIIRVAQPGDFSTYTLRFVLPGSSPVEPPPGWDRILSRIDFAFRVECPSDFDCAPADTSTAPAVPPPNIDYLAKDFQSFRRMMLDRLSVTLPDWKQSGPADMGVMLVELVAYAADHISYFQDAVGTEAYLSTARRRVSVRRHARLLDYLIQEGCNARTWVHLQVGQDVSGALPKGTAFLSYYVAAPVVKTDKLSDALNQGVTVFETMEAKESLKVAQNSIRIHTWSEDQCCLDAGATMVSLVSPPGGLGLTVGDWLLLEEVRGATTGNPADANPDTRHVVRITAVEGPVTDPVEGVEVVTVHWSTEDATPFSFCLEEAGEIGDRGPVTLARGNLVLADHGRSITVDQQEAEEPLSPGADLPGEGLVPPSVPSTGRYRPRLKQTGLCFAQPLPRTFSAAKALVQDPHEAVPQVRLETVDGEVWLPSADLLSANPGSARFVVELESDRRAWLRFGDGEYGRRPTAETRFRAFYRVGGGTVGNLGADSLVHVVSDTLNGAVTAIRNPLAARGGTEPERIEEVKRNAPMAFRVPRRAVTMEDWVAICEQHPEVQHAVATLRWNGSWYTVCITVDRRGGLPVDAAFEEELLTWLEPYRLAGYDLHIDPPQMVSLDLMFPVCVKPTWFMANVQQALLRAFSNGYGPDGKPGFFHPDQFSFGEPVYLSRLVATAMAVPGVASIDTTPKNARFKRWGAVPAGELERGYIPLGRLEIARLDNDPNAPENGRLLFQMRGGL